MTIGANPANDRYGHTYPNFLGSIAGKGINFVCYDVTLCGVNNFHLQLRHPGSRRIIQMLRHGECLLHPTNRVVYPCYIRRLAFTQTGLQPRFADIQEFGCETFTLVLKIRVS